MVVSLSVVIVIPVRLQAVWEYGRKSDKNESFKKLFKQQMEHEIKRQIMAMACKGSNFRLFWIPASTIPHLITFSIIFLFIACTKHSRLYLHLIS